MAASVIVQLGRPGSIELVKVTLSFCARDFLWLTNCGF